MKPNVLSMDMKSYRLKSTRRRKRLKRKDIEKALIKMDMYRTELWNQRAKLPMVALDQPYQKGWKRFFVLADEFKNLDTANFYLAILEKINTVQYSTGKNFTVKKRRKGKRCIHP